MVDESEGSSDAGLVDKTVIMEILTGGDNPRQLDEVPTGIRVNKRNTCSITGWKWAQRDDATWMVNDWIENCKKGEIWGVKMKDV